MASPKMEDIKINVKDTKPCAVTICVEVPAEDVKKETASVFDAILRTARVPGFRQGKAPMDMIRKNYTGAAREKVAENLVQSTVFAVLKEQGISPVDLPRVEEMDFDFDKPFSYTFSAERHPEFKVKDYKGIKITKEISPVSDERVVKMLNLLRERNARVAESAAEAAGKDSFVTVNYDASADGKKLEQLSARDYLIDLSSEQTLQGLREGLIGARKDEERSITVPFPAEHQNKRVAGKNVTFTVKVLGIKEKVIPALDDDFAKDMGVDDLEALRKKMRASLEAEETRRQNQEIEKQIIEYLLRSNSFPVPVSLVDEREKSLLERMENYLRQQGLPEPEARKHMEKAKETTRGEAENNIRLSYVLNAIAEAEKIEITEDELEAERQKIRSGNPGREKDAEKYFEEHKGSIKGNMKEEKLFKFLLDNAKVTEKTRKETAEKD